MQSGAGDEQADTEGRAAERVSNVMPELRQRHMRDVLRVTPLPLVALIDRCSMSVAELSRLKVGDVLPLPESTLDDIVIELDSGAERLRLAAGRLGARGRRKAV